MDSIFHRTSIRQYLDQEVEAGQVEQLLRAAMAAPSAANQRPWEYYVVTDKKKLEELSLASPYSGCAKGAPLAFVACFRKDCMMPEYVQQDLGASVENLLLEADTLGLGAVWLGIAPIEERMSKVKQILSIPGGLEAFAIIPCGYPLRINAQPDRFDQSRIHYVK